jgi:hypothetical protein
MSARSDCDTPTKQRQGVPEGDASERGAAGQHDHVRGGGNLAGVISRSLETRGEGGIGACQLPPPLTMSLGVSWTEVPDEADGEKG